MYLAVFQEFACPVEVVEKVKALPLTVDVAASPCTLAKTDGELDVVRSNAKLIFPIATAEADVDAAVGSLVALGFEVVQRHPVTSAGCPMRDRVVMRYPAPAAAPAAASS